MRPLRPYIGHHFYGAGNIGDDLMLAGFLAHLRASAARPVALDACTMFERGPLDVRFPEVRWHSYTPGERESLIAACDVWLGLGDSPFQTTSGPWFLDHLVADMEICRRHRKPMYFLGVGVNDAPAIGRPETRALLEYAEHVWTRDAQSAEMLASVGGAGKVTEGADLAHLWLGAQRFPAPERGVAGYLLNFESADAFDPRAFGELVAGAAASEQRWLVQEVRDFPGSERALFPTLPASARDALRVRLPDYASGSMRSIVDAWGVPETLVTSRYHGATVGAWLGSRVLPVWRNEKVVGLSRQLGLGGVSDLKDAAVARRALDEVRPVPAASLLALSGLAGRCCGEFLCRVGG